MSSKIIVFIVVLAFGVHLATSDDLEPTNVEIISADGEVNDQSFTKKDKHLPLGKDETSSIDMASFFNEVKNMTFAQALVSSFSVIVVSELGDRTFFLAASLAMNNPRQQVFAGIMSAVTLMHFVSAFAGALLGSFPNMYTFQASVILFLSFGVKSLVEAYTMKSGNQTVEMEDVQEEKLSKRRKERTKQSKFQPTNAPSSSKKRKNKPCQSIISKFVSPAMLQAFTMAFLSEWGDASQITTIALSTTKDINGILVGGLIGHFLCNTLAVLGGGILASKISVKTVTFISGMVFILQGLFSLKMGP